MAETDGDLAARLGTDPQAWAREFMARFDQSEIDATEGDLLPWFATAIGAGEIAGYRRGEIAAVEAVLARVLDGLFPVVAFGAQLRPDFAREVAGDAVRAMLAHGPFPQEGDGEVQSRASSCGTAVSPAREAAELAEAERRAFPVRTLAGVEHEFAVADVARDVLGVLEYYRRATGVDEWDEADDRTLLYSWAHEVVGEDGYVDVMGETGHPDRLVSLVDSVALLESAGMSDAAHLLRREFPS